jgi:hypothetical protein
MSYRAFKFPWASTSTTGVSNPSATPVEFALKQNYPNPFNPSTTIEYAIPHQSFVTVKIFDMLGREVTTLVEQMKDAGTYLVSWNASAMPTGVYFYRLQAGSTTQTRKLILMK